MTSEQKGKWELSYYMPIMDWSVEHKRVGFNKQAVRAHMEALRAAGVKWIGVDGINLLEDADIDVRATAEMVRDWLDELDLKVSSFHYAGPTFAAPGNSQEPVLRNLTDAVELFGQWRPKSFVVHPNWIYGASSTEQVQGAFAALSEKQQAQAVFDTVAANLKAMAQVAARHDIKLAIENMGHFDPLATPQTLPRLVEKIDEPNVGYCLDSGHAHMVGESVVQWVHTMGAKLFETHLHDNRGPVAWDEHMPPGFGTIPWLDVIIALEEIDFPGPVTFETVGWPVEPGQGGNPADPQKYRNAINWWRSAEGLADILKEKLRQRNS